MISFGQTEDQQQQGETIKKGRGGKNNSIIPAEKVPTNSAFTQEEDQSIAKTSSTSLSNSTSKAVQALGDQPVLFPENGNNLSKAATPPFMKEMGQVRASQGGIIVTPGPVIATPNMMPITLPEQQYQQQQPTSTTEGSRDEVLPAEVEITAPSERTNLEITASEEVPAADKTSKSISKGTTVTKRKNSSANESRTTKAKVVKKKPVREVENEELIYAPEVIITSTGQFDGLAPDLSGRRSNIQNVHTNQKAESTGNKKAEIVSNKKAEITANKKTEESTNEKSEIIGKKAESTNEKAKSTTKKAEIASKKAEESNKKKAESTDEKVESANNKVEEKAEGEGKKAGATSKKAQNANKKAEVANKRTDDTDKEAESAGKIAEIAGKIAESTGKKAGSAGKEAESTGKEAESTGEIAESASKTAENTSKIAESTGKKAESAGKKAENVGKKAESVGKKAESAGKKAEIASKEAESTDKEAERTSKKTENAGKISESAGKKAERVTKKAEITDEGKESRPKRSVGVENPLPEDDAAPSTTSTTSSGYPKRSREKTVSAVSNDQNSKDEEIGEKQVTKKSKTKDTKAAPSPAIVKGTSKKVETLVTLKKGDKALKIYVDVLTWYDGKDSCEYPMKDKKGKLLTWYVEGIVEKRSKPGVFYVKFPIFDDKSWICKPLKYFEEDYVFMKAPNGEFDKIITEKDRIKYEGS